MNREMNTKNNTFDMLKWTFAIIAVAFTLMLTCSAMSDDSSALDGGWYTLDEDTGVMTVTGPTTSSIDYNMRSMIFEVIITPSVTEIGNSTFNQCSKLTKVTFQDGCTLTTISNYAFSNSGIASIVIPNTVTSIGQGAFSGCQSLRSVNFEAGSVLESIGREAFNYSQILEKMGKIPASVTTIGMNFISSTKIKSVEFEAGTTVSNFDNVFYNATGLKSVVIPNTVTSAKNAFYNCTSLVDVKFGTGLTEIPASMFDGCKALRNVSLPAGITSIGNYAFRNTGLENITISVDIGKGVFQNCASLKIATFTTDPVSIPEYTFSGCSSLTTVNGLDNVTSFGNYVFQNCSSLTSFKMPDGVTTMSDYLFSGAGLVSIDLNNVTVIGVSALANTQLTSIDLSKVTKLGGKSLSNTKMTFVNLTGITDLGNVFQDSGNTLKKVVLDDSLVTIPNYMFQNCSGLTSVEYGDEIISFGGSAFYGCTSLKEIPIPAKLQTIGYQCFYQCGIIEFIATPTINSIGNDAFRYCDSLRVIDLSKASITTLNSNAISYCSALEELYLPEVLQVIKSRAITYCENLKSLHIPSSVTTLSEQTYEWNSYPFTDCYFETITGGEGLTYISPSAFVSMGADKIELNLVSNTEYVIYEGVLCKYVEGGYHAVLFPTITGDYIMPEEIVSTDGHAIRKLTATSITFSPNMPHITLDIAGYSEPNETLVRAIIPEGVISIRGGATGGSSWMGQGLFDWCIALKEVSLPSTLKVLGGSTFWNCTSLESITLPEGLTTIGEGNSQDDACVFRDCTSLKSINLPYNVSTIYYMTFSGCTSLESIDLSYIENIEQGAFNGCTALKEIKFGQYLTKIYQSFNDCNSLEVLELDGVELNVNNSFNNCTGLKKLIINADVKTFSNSFQKCYALEEIEVSAENPYLYENGGMLYSADLSTLYMIATSVEDVVIPDSVTKVSMPGAYGKVRSVVFGSGLTNFNSSCRWFSGIETLESVTIKNGIGRLVMCFDNCTSLKELILNEGITSVELEGCTSLKSISLPSTITMLSFDDMDAPVLEIHPDSENLEISGNVVYDSSTKAILAVLDRGSVTVPDGVSWNGYLDGENITVGNGIATIPAYGGFRNAKVVTLGEDVVYVGDYAFSNCPDITDIYILGDEIEFSQWAFNGITNEIRIHSGIDGEFITNVTGPTFVYSTGNNVEVSYEADRHVVFESYPPQIATEGGDITFSAKGENGYLLSVTVTAGILSSEGDVYTVTGIPAGGTKIVLTTTFVGVPTEKIELERTTLSVMSGDDILLGFAVTPFDSSDDVVWTSSDESVVSITNDGIVAVKSGVATLTATAGNQSASCEIVVSAPAVGDEQDNDNSVSITIGACVGALVLIGIASVLIYRRF